MKTLSYLIRLLFMISVFLICFGGIFRDDVGEQKYLDLANQKQFNSVGKVYDDTTFSGSCVYIQKRFFLTAAHLFIEYDEIPDTIRDEGKTIYTYRAENPHQVDISNFLIVINGEKLKIKNVIIHPNYLSEERSCDIALIEVEKKPASLKPARLNVDEDEFKSHVVGVGYGSSGPAGRPDLVGSYQKKIAGENVIDSISGPEYQGKPTLLYADFDHSSKDNCNKMGDSKPLPLEYISSGGDSGGGLFREKKGKWELIGITTGNGIDIEQFYQTFYYGQTAKWTRVSVFKDWIEENIP